MSGDRAVAAGRDASGGGIRAELAVSAEPADRGTALRAHAELYLSGRAAQFGRSIAGDVSRQLFAQFGACVERTPRGTIVTIRSDQTGIHYRDRKSIKPGVVLADRLVDRARRITG